MLLMPLFPLRPMHLKVVESIEFEGAAQQQGLFANVSLKQNAAESTVENGFGSRPISKDYNLAENAVANRYSVAGRMPPASSFSRGPRLIEN